MATSPTEIVSAPGFFDQPEAAQVKALSAANPKFKGYAPDVQRGILQKARAQFGGGAQPAAPPPGPAAAKPSGESGGIMSTPLLQRVGLDKPIESLAGKVGAGAQYVTSLPARGIAAITGHSKEFQEGEGHAEDFSRGIGEGLAQTGVGMTSPTNMALMIPSLFGGGVLAKMGKAGKLLGAGLRTGFSLSMMKDLIAEVPEAAEAFQKGDYRAAGQAVSKSLADLYFLRETRQAGKRAKAPKTEAAPPPGPETSGPPTDVELNDMRRLGRQFRGQMSQEMDDLVKQRDKVQRGTPEYDQLSQRIKEVTQKFDRSLQTEGRGGKPKPEESAAWDTKGQRREEHPPIRTTEARQKERTEAAKKRAEEQDPTSLWRTWGEGLGIRTVPEETGELPTKIPTQKPRELGEQPVKPEPSAQPETSGGRENPEGRVYIANKIPGIPPGTQIIPHGIGPKGYQVSIVDNGRVLQTRSIPFRDSLRNMTAKGWLTPQPLEGSENLEPVESAAPPPGKPVEERGSFPRKALPPPGSSAAPPPGPMPSFNPYDVAKGWQSQWPRVRGQIADQSGVKSVEMTPEQQIESAKQQPTEVVRNFVQKMQQSFLDKVRGLDPKTMSPEAREQVKGIYQEFQDYLKPYLDIIREREGTPDKPTPPKPAQAKPAASSQGATGTTPPAKKGSARKSQAAPAPPAPEKKAPVKPPLVKKPLAVKVTPPPESKPGVTSRYHETVLENERARQGTPASDPAVSAMARDLIDTNVRPKDSVKSPWSRVVVRILGADRKAVFEDTVPNNQFTEDYVHQIVGENPRGWAIEISNPDAASKDKRISVIQRTQGAPPPNPQ